MTSTAVSIVGASGYSGIELYKLLRHHPGVRIKHLYGQASAGKRVDELYPELRSHTEMSFEPFGSETTRDSDVIFIALPSGEAMRLVPDMLSLGVRVIDLGGDFRLRSVAEYTSYYKREHTAPEQLSQAVYSVPELHRSLLKSASLVSNPGCYPTSAILPLAPLLKEEIIEPEGITINSLSGVSGAGRSASIDLSFAEVNESVKPYKVGVHQHTPEIEATLSAVADATVRVTFTPHLLPITRGIATTITARLSGTIDENRIRSCFDRWYAAAPFVRLLGQRAPEIRNVLRTNFIDIGWHLYPRNGHLILMSAIDNLVKGAAGQAVQNFNLMCGYDESEGLL